MTDLQETPAVPPEDYGGDERAGLAAAGATLVGLGWLLGVVVNLLLHLEAPASGTSIGPVVVHNALGPFAWTTLLIGALTGAVGLAIVILSRAAPRGPLVLPGRAY